MCEVQKICVILIIKLLIKAILMEDYHAGDTLNVFIENNNKIGDIFNGYNGSKYIKTENINHNAKYIMSHEICLRFESLKEYIYPEVHIDGRKSTSLPSKLFSHLDVLRDQYLGINHFYVNDHIFTYGIVKLCKMVETQSVDIELITEKDFPQISNGISYNILWNKTAVFRLRRDNETHYVSSISTGTCLLQITIRENPFCMNPNDSLSSIKNHEFFTNPVYRSHIITVTNNRQLEKIIDRYFFLNDINYSLFAFPELNFNHQESVLKMLENDAILNFKLQSFPELSTHKIKSTRQMSHEVKPVAIVPGDVFNIEELVDSESRNISVENVLIHKNNYLTAPFVTSYYEKCFEKNQKGGLNFEAGEYNYFDERMRILNYGVDEEYATDHTTCSKIIICSELRMQDLYFPLLNILKLNEKSKDNLNNNIFENETILLLFANRNQTHYVTSTKKGNCLLQMLVFPVELSYFKNNSGIDVKVPPIHKGRILSATENYTLERWAETLTQKDLSSTVSEKNINIISAIFGELHHEDSKNDALISLFLKELY